MKNGSGKNTERAKMIYIPPEGSVDLTPSTIGVKFSNDTFLMEAYLKHHAIEYDEKDLEEAPFGRCLRIKKKE